MVKNFLIKLTLVLVFPLFMSLCTVNAQKTKIKLYDNIHEVDFKEILFPKIKKENKRNFPYFDMQKDDFDVTVKYGNLTDPSKEDAAVMVWYGTGGGSGHPSQAFVYSLNNHQLVQVARFEQGDRALGGYKSITIQNQTLTVERFGTNEGCFACYNYIEIKKYKINGHKLLKVGKTEKTPYKEGSSNE